MAHRVFITRPKARVYEFNQVHNGAEYSHKRVEVCYLEEGDAIVVVTV